MDAARGSKIAPRLKVVGPTVYQGKLTTAGQAAASRPIAAASASRDVTKAAPIARIAITPLSRGRPIVATTISRRPTMGRAGISQRYDGMRCLLPLHQVDFVDVDRAASAVDRQNDGKRDRRFRGGDGNDEERQDLAVQAARRT